MSDRQEPAGSQPGSRIVGGNVPEAGSTSEADVDATDAAAQLAKDNGIDLATLTGSGTDGRVLVSDVQAAIDAQANG